jgi:hypothetical protein
MRYIHRNTMADYVEYINCAEGEHDTRVSAQKCGACGKDLCDLCGSSEHFTADGHDLSSPRYWGI